MGSIANFYSPGKARVFVGAEEADLCLQVVSGKETKDNQPKLTFRQKGSKVDGKLNYAVTADLGLNSTDDLTLTLFYHSRKTKIKVNNCNLDFISIRGFIF